MIRQLSVPTIKDLQEIKEKEKIKISIVCRNNRFTCKIRELNNDIISITESSSLLNALSVAINYFNEDMEENIC